MASVNYEATDGSWFGGRIGWYETLNAAKRAAGAQKIYYSKTGASWKKIEGKWKKVTG